MKKKLTLLTIALMCLANIKAQNIKTFKGELSGGTQTYTYYENDKGDLVKNGKYHYTKNNKGLVYNITGEFKDGKRKGLWIFNITYSNWVNNNMSFLGYKKMSMSYLNGVPHGTCKYSTELQTRHPKYINGRKQWGKYDKKTISSLTFNFKNGILVGKFTINDGIAKVKVSGSFNENSFADGVFSTQDDFIHTKTTATYKNGIPIVFNKINLNSGKSEYNLKNDPIVFKLCNDLANNKINSSELPKTDKNFYTLDTVLSIAPIKSSLKTFIYQDDFLFYEIGGDLNYNNGDIKFGGNKAIIVVKYGYQTLGRDFSAANSSFDSKNYKSALEDYESILYAKKYLTESDKNLVLSKIDSCKKELKEIEISYKHKVSVADTLFNLKEYKKAIIEYEKAINFVYNTKINTEYSKKKISESKEILEKQNELINNLIDNNNIKKEKVKDLYVVVDKILTQVNGSTQYKTRKKKLYKAYELVISDFESQIINENNNEKKIQLLKKESDFIDKIIELSNENTKELEKNLKNINNPKEILSLIFN